MGAKSDHNGLSANALRQSLHLVEDGLVAEVDTIKSADSDHGVRDVAGFYDVMKNFHYLKY